jgi:hypothetical protein
VLRGAGVTLALPWLESLQPRGAHAQNVSLPKRFITVFFPCGAPQDAPNDFWGPVGTGQGDAWQLSGILEPFAALKARMLVLGGVENFSAFSQADGGQSHGRAPGAFLTCANVVQIQNDASFPDNDLNGVSVDQKIAQHELHQGITPLPSLELTLGTSDNACDGPPCSYSRNISWKATPGTDFAAPNLPELDPGAVYDRIVGAGSNGQLRRHALDQSVIDYVLDSAATLQPRLGAADRGKVDEFLTSVRALEQRLAQFPSGSGRSCEPLARPTFAVESGINENVPEGYNKEVHADLMNDLMVLALQCDTTRVITHMLENERSEFVYDHISKRTFTGTSSVETGQPVGNYHGAASGNAHDFASIIRWEALKTAELCQRLAAIEDAPGTSVLDNTVVYFASCLEGYSHYAVNLPIVLIGGLGGTLKTDQHLILPDRPLRDLYFTLMNQGFNLGVTDFGNSTLNDPISTISEILA